MLNPNPRAETLSGEKDNTAAALGPVRDVALLAPNKNRDVRRASSCRRSAAEVLLYITRPTCQRIIWTPVMLHSALRYLCRC